MLQTRQTLFFSDYKTKTFKALPTISISRTPTGNVPTGANVDFTAAGAGSGGSYSWGFGSTSNPATSAINSTSTINVTGTDEDGCQNTASESVTVVALVAGTITSATNIVCTGDVPGALTQTAAASGGSGSGYTYSWYKKTGSGSYSAISGATTATYTPTATVTSTTYFRRDITNLGVTVQGTPFMFTVSTLPSISIASTASTVSSGNFGNINLNSQHESCILLTDLLVEYGSEHCKCYSHASINNSLYSYGYR